MKVYGGIIHAVEKNSIADELGILPGDILLEINGYTLRDMIDYKFHVMNEEIELKIKHMDNSFKIYDIEKDFEDDLGLTFENAVFDRIKTCNNKCIFCFIDQQPEGLRESLYIKDDDYRLSYLQGNYVTLTNLTTEDRQRIEEVRPGPLYVSVHATYPEVRAKLLKNPNGGHILKEIDWLEKLEIPIHAQIVLCPEHNDGEIFHQTLTDLSHKKNIESIAVVPYGNTHFRKENFIRDVTQQDAQTVLKQCHAFNNTLKTPLVFPSDEFYILAGENFPTYSKYKEFPQLEDGVGTARMFLESFLTAEKFLPVSVDSPLNGCVLTGKIGYTILFPVIERLNLIKNICLELIPVESHFWGKEITVTGLIVGQDIVETLQQTGKIYDKIMLPAVMLRKGSDQFMDNMTVKQLENKLATTVDIIYDYYNAQALINSVLSEETHLIKG